MEMRSQGFRHEEGRVREGAGGIPGRIRRARRELRVPFRLLYAYDREPFPLPLREGVLRTKGAEGLWRHENELASRSRPIANFLLVRGG